MTQNKQAQSRRPLLPLPPPPLLPPLLPPPLHVLPRRRQLFAVDRASALRSGVVAKQGEEGWGKGMRGMAGEGLGRRFERNAT